VTRPRSLLLLGAALLVGCSAPSGSVYTPSALPEASDFPYVAEFMVHRCGTLDCHGSLYRNLRVFGDEGLRFSSADRPCIPTYTTATEILEDYDSIVGLEPETMSAVVGDHGADPERLTLIAKPLGIEAHKGGMIFQQGEPGYACMTSWLSGKTDTTACLAAMPDTICGASTTLAVDAGAP
jgi:hypothetical protein